MSETRKFAATVGCVGHSRRYQLGGCNREYVGGWLKRDGVPSVSGSRTISFTPRSRSAYLHRKTGPTCSQLICSLGT
jgi:hypothetical protein